MKSFKSRQILWVAWEKQRRSTVLARHLGADLYQFQYQGNFLWRYLYLSAQTLALLWQGTVSVRLRPEPIGGALPPGGHGKALPGLQGHRRCP